MSRTAPVAALVAIAAGSAVLGSGGPARGQAADAALAESLFQEGRRLMDKKSYDAACPKIQASLQLDPGAGGTLMTLALCHELQGKTASAWGEFSDAVAAAKRDNRPERAKAAQDHLTALDGKLSKLTVIAPPEVAGTPGLVLKRDGAPLVAAAWGIAVAVDPGKHTVSAVAPGRREWSQEIDVGANAARVTVNVPALEELPVAPPPPPSASAPVSAAPVERPPPPPPPDPTRRNVGYVLGAVGVVGLGVGGFFGLRAVSKGSDVKSACPGGVCASQSDVDANDQAHTAARIADVGMGLGLASLAVGAYLVLSSPSSEAPTTVGFASVPGGATLSARGAW